MQPLHPVAYSVGGYHGPILPTGSRSDVLAAVVAKLGTRGAEVATAYGDLPKIVHASEYDWAARQEEERRERECFSLDRRGRRRSARVRLPSGSAPGRTSAGEHAYVTDAEWLADRLVQKIAAHAAAEAERKQRRTRGARVRRRRTIPSAKRAGRSGNGSTRRASPAAPATSTSAPRSPGGSRRSTPTRSSCSARSCSLHYGKAAAWAHRLCVEQPTTTNKQGKVTVRYPRGAQAEKQLHEQATAALMRARTPEAALAVVLRLLVAQRLADTDGLPNADRQGIYEPQELAGSKVVDKLARRVAPPSVKQHVAERMAERERSRAAGPRASEEAARIEAQRAKLAAGEAIRCECCLDLIETPEAAVEKHGTLVHVGDCERAMGQQLRVRRRPRRDQSDRYAPTPSAPPTNLDSTRDADAS